MAQTVEHARNGAAATDAPRIAYLAECGPAYAYCQARLDGAEAAAAHFSATIQLYDADFDTATQLQQVQDAVQEGYDGYVFSPVTDASGCANLELLQATGKPVATINSPMCGNADYTEGTVGFVGIQTTDYFQDFFDNAFGSCADSCTVVAVGGALGSDLYGRWHDALVAAAAEHPEVRIANDQPAGFDPTAALAVVQDSLRADPGIDLVVSANDDMTVGAVQAIVDAGLVPGRDVHVHSVGGSAAAVAEVATGRWDGTAVLLPYDESYFGVTQLMRKLSTGEDTPGFAYLAEAPAVVDGPGSVFLTSANVARFEPQW
jgi:ABC-type sugar transport system substrate-binding protein